MRISNEGDMRLNGISGDCRPQNTTSSSSSNSTSVRTQLNILTLVAREWVGLLYAHELPSGIDIGAGSHTWSDSADLGSRPAVGSGFGSMPGAGEIINNGYANSK